MKHACFIAAAIAVALLGFAAPANATHVSCGATITASTTLDSDVECPATFTGVAVTLAASDVTLRLGRHTIRTLSPTPSGTGVRSSGLVSGQQLRNGSIEGFEFGVLLLGSNSSAQRVRVTGGSGMQLNGVGSSAILNEMVGTANIVMGPDAYATRNTGGSIGTVGNNPRIVVNRVNCIFVNGYTTAAVVAKNTVTGACPSAVGIQVFVNEINEPGGAEVRRNLVTGTGGNLGIRIRDPAGFVWCNTANGNGTGILIDLLPGTTVQKNTANNNNIVGIDATEGTIDGGGNTATGNGSANCINVSCGPPPDPPCAAPGA